jgi:outer membrane PBP1 activator LpoA protein
MNIQSGSGAYEADTVVAFPPGAKDAASDGVDQLDRAGQTILKLLHKAAGVTEQNSRQALDMAQKLSHQLRAAEDRIAELEAEVDLYREKSDRAEQWLHKVYTEIEERFIRQPTEKRRAIFGSAGQRVDVA